MRAHRAMGRGVISAYGAAKNIGRVGPPGGGGECARCVPSSDSMSQIGRENEVRTAAPGPGGGAGGVRGAVSPAQTVTESRRPEGADDTRSDHRGHIHRRCGYWARTHLHRGGARCLAVAERRWTTCKFWVGLRARDFSPPSGSAEPAPVLEPLRRWRLPDPLNY